MIGETPVLYLDPRSTCGQTDLADSGIGQLPCHSPHRAIRGALIVYIESVHCAKFNPGGGGWRGGRPDTVQSASSGFVCVSVEDPGAWGPDPESCLGRI